MSNVIRLNLVRLLGLCRSAVLVGAAVFAVLGLWKVDAPAYYGVFVAALALYFVVTLAMIALGGVRTWPSVGLLAGVLAVGAGVYSRALGSAEEVLWMLGAVGGVVLVRQLTRQPVAAREKSVGGAGAAPATPAPEAEPEVRPIHYEARKPSVTFANVVGMEDLKARLLDAGNEIVASGKKGVAARNGIMLSGDPGNGKTFLAEALAGQLRLKFLSVSFSDIGSRFINQSSEQVREAFEDAARQAPCLLFIDEIDSLARDRSSQMSTSEEGPKTTNVLLTKLVDIRRAGVVVVAATNHLDALDPAVVREGRFDFKVEVTTPDAPARAGIIKAAVGKWRGLRFDQGALEQAAKRWAGFSVVRIQSVIEQAGRDAKQAGRPVVSYEHLQEALRTVQGQRGRIPEDTPDLSLIAMAPDQHAELLSVAERMKCIEQIEEMGGSVPAGLLFAGPPGTGKTLTARALAKTTGWAFLEASGNALIGDPKELDRLTAKAKDIRPTIVFIDEADDILADRAVSPSHVASATNKLLAAVDGAGGKTHDILWIAATNHPDRLDSAAVRGGRFTEKFMFDTPTREVVADYVNKWIGASKAAFGADVTPDVCADLLEGEPIANIKEVLQQAINSAIARGLRAKVPPVVGLDDVRAGVRRVLG